jgi:hypothetical protein
MTCTEFNAGGEDSAALAARLVDLLTGSIAWSRATRAGR